MTELQQTNLEKTLLAWCRQNSQVKSRSKDKINFSSYLRNKFLRRMSFLELPWG